MSVAFVSGKLCGNPAVEFVTVLRLFRRKRLLIASQNH